MSIRVLIFSVLVAATSLASPSFDYTSYHGGEWRETEQRIVLGDDHYTVMTNVWSNDMPTTNGCISDECAIDSFSCSEDVHITVFSYEHKLLYGTYLGTSGGETPVDLIELEDGDLLLSYESKFEIPAVDNDYTANQNIVDRYVYIARLSGDLTTIRWSTLLGDGTSFNRGGDLTVADHYVAITWESINWEEDSKSEGTGVVTTLDLEDGTRVDSRRFEGTYRGRIESAPDGTLILAGGTDDRLPATAGAFDTEIGGFSDGYLMKLTPELDILWCTFLGGSGREPDTVADFAPDGSIIFSCRSLSADFPVPGTTWGPAFNGVDDLVVGRLSADGSELVWAGWFGGAGMEFNASLDVDDQGHLMVAGSTASPDFPVTPDAPYTVNPSDWSHGFIAEFDAYSGDLTWSTLIAGSYGSKLRDLAVAGDRFGLVGFTGTYLGNETPMPPSFDAFDTTVEQTEGFVILGGDPDHVGNEPTDPSGTPLPNLSAPTLSIHHDSNAAVALRVGLPVPSNTSIDVFDLRGRVVANIQQGPLTAGHHDLRWTPNRQSPGGIYFVVLRTADQMISRSVTIR